jgi:hypothetical protein
MDLLTPLQWALLGVAVVLIVVFIVMKTKKK